MVRTKLLPEPTLLLRVETAFLEHGYAAPSLSTLAESCELPPDGLDDYFDDKDEAFRAVGRYRNEMALSTGLVRDPDGYALQLKVAAKVTPSVKSVPNVELPFTIPFTCHVIRLVPTPVSVNAHHAVHVRRLFVDGERPVGQFRKSLHSISSSVAAFQRPSASSIALSFDLATT